MDSPAVGSLLVRSRPPPAGVPLPPTEIVPYKIPYGIVDYVLANRYTGEGHPGEHLLYLSQLCSLSVLMDSSAIGSLLVRSRPTTVVVTPTPTEIVPYKIPYGIL